MEIREKLEKHYKEMQDIEFTVQDGKLYMLQTRTGKRTGTAAVRIAVEMVKEKLIDETTAVKRVQPGQPQPPAAAAARPEGEGRSRSPRASPPAPAPRRARSSSRPRRPSSTPRSTRTSRSCSSARRPAPKTSPACTWRRASSPAPAARRATRPSSPAAGASRASSAARPSRSTSKAGRSRSPGKTVKAGDFLTIDGSTGDVMIGKVPTVAPTMTGDFATLMKWADKDRTLKIRTNADTPGRRRKAREFGAEGIGLCRTEHMFFDDDRIVAMREMILRRRRGRPQGGAGEARAVPAGGLRRHLRGDGRPAGDDPPARPAAARVPAARREGPGRSRQAARHHAGEGQGTRRRSCTSSTRCSGFRGCRLPIVFPEIGDMQVRAIIEAAIEVQEEGQEGAARDHDPAGRHRRGTDASSRSGPIAVAEECMKKAGVKVEYLIGTMIELPRAVPDGRRDRRGGRVLLLRHQRPDADDLRLQPRRHQRLPADLPEGEDPAGRPVPVDRRQRRRPADRDRRQEGPRQPARRSTAST